MAHSSPLQPGDAADLTEDVRRLFGELAEIDGGLPPAYSGDYHPSLDVRETEHTIDVTVDVAGVPADAIRVLFRSGVVLIAGVKAPSPAPHLPVFHLVEREFGRFARAVRLTGAFDVTRARATLRDGELTITFPKRPERRGVAHGIPIT